MTDLCNVDNQNSLNTPCLHTSLTELLLTALPASPSVLNSKVNSLMNFLEGECSRTFGNENVAAPSRDFYNCKHINETTIIIVVHVFCSSRRGLVSSVSAY